MLLITDFHRILKLVETVLDILTKKCFQLDSSTLCPYALLRKKRFSFFEIRI